MEQARRKVRNDICTQKYRSFASGNDKIGIRYFERRPFVDTGDVSSIRNCIDLLGPVVYSPYSLNGGQVENMEQVYVLREKPNGNNLTQIEELSFKLLI